jgi:hypothetical protein
MPTSAERMRAYRERVRRGLQRFTISVSADDLSVITEHGYEGAVTTDLDQQAQAVGDSIACLDRTCFRPNDQLRRNATALQPHVTLSHTPLHRHSSVGK